MKPYYSIIHPIVLSFYSRDLYLDVARNWKTGRTLFYLFFLLAMLWLASALHLHRVVGAYVEEHAPKLLAECPTITIQDGVLSIDRPQPYEITDPSSGELVAIIDTTGKTTGLDQSPASVLVTKHDVLYRQSAVETRTFSLSKIKQLTFDKDAFASMLTSIQQWLAVMLYPFAVIGVFIYRMIQVLLYAAIGALFARSAGTVVGFDARVRLSILAITPVAILDTVRTSADASIPFWGLICFAITMGYLHFGVKAAAQAAA